MDNRNPQAKTIPPIKPLILVVGLTASSLIAIYSSILAYTQLPPDPANWIWAAVYGLLIGGFGYLLTQKKYAFLQKFLYYSSLLFAVIILVFSGNGPAVFAWIWLTVLSMGIGCALLKIFKIWTNLDFLEQILLATTLGLCSLALLIYLIGTANVYASLLNLPARYFKLLDKIPVFGLLIALSILVTPGVVNIFKDWQTTQNTRLNNLIDQNQGLASIALTVFWFCFWGVFIWALSPTIRFDSLVYHLAAPEKYIEYRGIYEVTEPMQFYLSHYGEMLFTLGQIVAGQPLPNLTHLLSGLLLIGFTWLIGNRLGNPLAGGIGAVLLLSAPLFYDAGTAHNDFFVALFSVAGLYCLFGYKKDHRTAWLLLAGLLIGFAVGVKVNAAVMAVIGLIFLFIIDLRNNEPVKKVFQRVLAFCIPVGAAYVPWAILNLVWARNPFYPFLCQIFSCPNHEINPISGNTSIASKLISDFVFLAWNTTVNGQNYYIENFGGAVGGVLLFSLPWFFLGKDKNIRQKAIYLSALTVMGSLMFTPIAGRTRALYPILPFLCVLAGLNFFIAWKQFSPNNISRSLKVTGVIVIGIYFLATRLVFTSSGWQIPERYPLGVAFGFESQQAYLSRILPAYDALQFLSHQGNADFKVASIGSEARIYTLTDIHTPYYSNEITEIIDSANNPSELAKLLNNAGYKYILEDRGGLLEFPESYDRRLVNESFLSGYTRLVFARHDVFVYKLLPELEKKLPPPGNNLLMNGGFESLLPDGTLSNWTAFGKPQLDQSGTQAQSGKNAVRLSDFNYLYQRLEVEGGKLYTLGHWSTSSPIPQLARLQIMWLNRSGRQIETTIVKFELETTWKWNQMSYSAPDDAVYAQVYITTDDELPAWFDNACFSQGPECN